MVPPRLTLIIDHALSQKQQKNEATMKDRAGQVYLMLGSLMAGAAASTLLSGSYAHLPIWGLGLVALIGLYMSVAVLADWWLPWRKSSLVLVVESARELSRSIATWIGDRRRDEPLHSFEDWNASIERSGRHHTDTMIRWNERYSVEALTAYDRMVAHGADADISGWGGRHVFEHPTNTLGIEEAGRTLGVMAADLEKKKLTRG